MASSSHTKLLTPDEYQQRGTFYAVNKKEGCDKDVIVEIKLTGAPRRWKEEIKQLIDEGQEKPDLLETTAFNLNTRNAAKLKKFLADPEYEDDTIISVVTAAWAPDYFQEVLNDERSRIKKPETKSKEIQIQNLANIVHSMDNYYHQAPKDRTVHHRTTRARKMTTLTERREGVVSTDSAAFLNITNLLSGRTLKGTPKNPQYGDSHYAFVGMKSRFLISAKTPKEDVAKILTAALNRLEAESNEGVQGAGELLRMLRDDIENVKAINEQRVSAAPVLRVSPRSEGRVSPRVSGRVSPSLSSPQSQGSSGRVSPVETGKGSPVDFRGPQGVVPLAPQGQRQSRPRRAPLEASGKPATTRAKVQTGNVERSQAGLPFMK